MTDTILVTKENEVATVTFNRPDKMNTFNRDMAIHLEHVLDVIRNDPSIRVLVLRGQGEVFMAGNDIYELQKEMNLSSNDTLKIMRHFNACITLLREMDKPVLAVVHGLVTGTGMSFMLAADLILSSAATQFSLGFSRLSMSPIGGVSYHLPRLIGMKQAAELLFFSEDFGAEMAKSMGLINWVVQPDQVEEKTHQVIERLVHGPTMAYARTKQLLHASWQNKIPAQLELEAESFIKSTQTRDFKESVRAVLNKRLPEYEGR